MRLLYPAAWVAFAAIYAAALMANGLGPGLAFRNAVANLLPGALLGLLVLSLPSRLPWLDHGRSRFLFLHLLLLTGFVIVSCTGWFALVNVDAILFGGSVRGSINYRLIPFRILNDVLIYCTLTGIAYARWQARRAAEAETLRARASLEAMRSQLNPHFILNTFHALIGLVRRDPATAEKAIERLGDLLRYSLRVQREAVDEVAMRDECAFVSSYLELERLRLGDRLQVDLDVSPSAMDTLVPAFAVQTLAENAVRHAIAPRASGGRLQIRVRDDDRRLHVAVSDEGEGELPARTEGSGVGLRLLQDRLTALYGGNATLTLQKLPAGTSARLDLPARVAT
jgi:LytS/YehU family sensor histidine kinase